MVGPQLTRSVRSDSGAADLNLIVATYSRRRRRRSNNNRKIRIDSNSRAQRTDGPTDWWLATVYVRIRRLLLLQRDSTRLDSICRRRIR